LVLQQEIAEELERERKRNKKELSALQNHNASILRQRDEAQRVVLHLRSLISGQTHHMEHIVRTINKHEVPELEELEQELGSEVAAEDSSSLRGDVSTDKKLTNRRSFINNSEDSGMETRFYDSPRVSKRLSQISIIDVADRHLRDKTDAIAHIIRNISEQCAAAVEGLQLAHDADAEEGGLPNRKRSSGTSTIGGSESGMDSEIDDARLHPGRFSSIPPTPDLIHRSSTSMSISSSTTTPERSSLNMYHNSTDIPTRIVEDEDEELAERSDVDLSHDAGVVGKHHHLAHRASGARISALNGS
jgi:hypothetical protein